MALKAGYYGIKRRTKNLLLNLINSLPPGISPENPVASKSDVLTTVDLLKDTTGWVGGNELPMTLTNLKAINTVGTWNNNVYTDGGISITVSVDASDHVTEISVSGTSTKVVNFNYIKNFSTSGERVLSVGNASEDYRTFVTADDESGDIVNTSATIDHVTYNTVKAYTIHLIVYSGKILNNVKFYVMVCTPEQYAISPTYEPYHESVEEMLTTKTLTSADDIDNVFADGWYKWSGGSIPTHWVGGSWAAMRVITVIGAILQIGYTQNEIYIRRYGGSPQSWGSFTKFTGTEVTS